MKKLFLFAIMVVAMTMFLSANQSVKAIKLATATEKTSYYLDEVERENVKNEIIKEVKKMDFSIEEFTFDVIDRAMSNPGVFQKIDEETFRRNGDGFFRADFMKYEVGLTFNPEKEELEIMLKKSVTNEPSVLPLFLLLITILLITETILTFISSKKSEKKSHIYKIKATELVLIIITIFFIVSKNFHDYRILLFIAIAIPVFFSFLYLISEPEKKIIKIIDYTGKIIELGLLIFIITTLL